MLNCRISPVSRLSFIPFPRQSSFSLTSPLPLDNAPVHLHFTYPPSPEKKSTGTVEWTLLAVTAVRTIIIIITRLCYIKFPLFIIAHTEEKGIRRACRSLF